MWRCDRRFTSRRRIYICVNGLCTLYSALTEKVSQLLTKFLWFVDRQACNAKMSTNQQKGFFRKNLNLVEIWVFLNLVKCSLGLVCTHIIIIIRFISGKIYKKIIIHNKRKIFKKLDVNITKLMQVIESEPSVLGWGLWQKSFSEQVLPFFQTGSSSILWWLSRLNRRSGSCGFTAMSLGNRFAGVLMGRVHVGDLVHVLV